MVKLVSSRVVRFCSWAIGILGVEVGVEVGTTDDALGVGVEDGTTDDALGVGVEVGTTDDALGVGVEVGTTDDALGVGVEVCTTDDALGVGVEVGTTDDALGVGVEVGTNDDALGVGVEDDTPNGIEVVVGDGTNNSTKVGVEVETTDGRGVGVEVGTTDDALGIGVEDASTESGIEVEVDTAIPLQSSRWFFWHPVKKSNHIIDKKNKTLLIIWFWIDNINLLHNYI